MKTSRALTLFLALALLALVLLALSTPTARADSPVIVRVKVNGATSGTCGDTWETACGLQYALTSTVALPGTELWVAAGTYTPTTEADRTATFQLRDGIGLYGGFAGGETLRSARNFTTNVTILSGDIGTPNIASDNSYHVVTGSGVTNTAVLDGFTVTGGRADGPNGSSYVFGGGMYDLLANPTVSNVIFDGNSASQYGGGMYDYHSSPLLTNVVFSGNSGGNFGGGMSNWEGSRPALTNVTFISNTAEFGGGMLNDTSVAALSNVTFISNTAETGGGMYNYYAHPTLTNVTFFGNSATEGGGIDNFLSSQTLTNVTFAGNSATNSGGGMSNYGSVTIRNAIFWGNTASNGPQFYSSSGTPTIDDSVVQGSCPGNTICTHIIADDPHLGTLGDYGGNTQTIPLLPGSSAIDTGNETTCAPVLTDQRGKPRVATCDIGAFESQGFTLTKTSGDNQSTLRNTPFANPLRVMVSSAPGEPVNGGVVTFTAPSLGASAIPVTSIVMIASGAVSLSLTANSTVGSYAVTANTTGATAPVTFSLTNSLYENLYLPLLRR